MSTIRYCVPGKIIRFARFRNHPVVCQVWPRKRQWWILCDHETMLRDCLNRKVIESRAGFPWQVPGIPGVRQHQMARTVVLLLVFTVRVLAADSDWHALAGT